MSRLKPIHLIKQTNSINTGTVLFLHGSGDTGKGILDWVKFVIEDFSLPHVKFLFPTAPLQPYTPLDGQRSNVWFNSLGIAPDVPEDLESLKNIEGDIKSLIAQEVDAGIPLNRIIIGGFSMGGALSLHSAYRFMPGVAGAFVLSSFLNSDSIVYKSLQSSETPLLMCHGDKDTLVPLAWGQNTFESLTKLGVKGEFHPIKNTLHELKRCELRLLLEWINRIIPNNV